MNRILLALYAAIFLDLVGFGMMFPDVQLRAEALGAKGWLIGLILASYYIVQMIASPRWGALSDRLGRKPALLACGTISALSMVVYALGNNVWWMLASRAVAGLGAANVVIAQAIASDHTQGDARSIAQGRISAAISAGLVLGPALGGVLGHFGDSHVVGLVAAGFSLVGTLWIAFALPKNPSVKAEKGEEKPKDALAWDGILPLLLVASLGWLALAFLEGTFGRLIERTLGLGRLEFGLILALDGIAAVLQGAFFPALVKRNSPQKLLRIAFLLQAVGLATIPFARHLALLIPLNALFGIGVGLANPTINALASQLTAPERQGIVFGRLQSARSVGFLFGPILGGVLFDVGYSLPYLLAGGLALLAAAVGYDASRGKKRAT